MIDTINDAELEAINKYLRFTEAPEIPAAERAQHGFVYQDNLERILIPSSKGSLDLTSRLKHKITPLVSGNNRQLRLKHTLKPEFALLMLQNQNFHLRPITQQHNDKNEYEHAHAAAYAFKTLSRLPQPVLGQYNAARARGERMYVGCMTMADEYHSESFMVNYGHGDHNAVRIYLDINLLSSNAHGVNGVLSGNSPPCLTLGRVIYDDGALLDAFKDLRAYLFANGTELLVNGFASIAPFFKRTKYSWEHEVRLLLDVQGSTPDIFDNPTKFLKDVEANIAIAQTRYGCSFTPDRSGVNLPLNNPFVTIEPCTVVIGKNVSVVDKNPILAYCDRVGIERVDLTAP